MMDFEGKKYQWGGTGVNAVPVTLTDENGTGVAEVALVDSAGVIATEKIRTFSTEITIGAAAYTAGKVIDVTKAIAGVAKAAGYGITVVGARMQTDESTALAGKNIRFHLYNDSPTNIPADNAAMTLDIANIAKREGTIQLTFGTGNMSTVGADNYTNLNFNPVGTSIYVVAENVDGHTPSGAKKITLYLKVIQGN